MLRGRIETAWLTYRHLVIPADAASIQIKESRRAFYAGAESFLTAMMSMLDPNGEEPTAADLLKMDEIANELYRIWENGKIISEANVDDPFVRTTIVPKGWSAAWLVLRGKLTFQVVVDGTQAAHRVVFRGDYTAEPQGPPQRVSLRDITNAH